MSLLTSAPTVFYTGSSRRFGVRNESGPRIFSVSSLPKVKRDRALLLIFANLNNFGQHALKMAFLQLSHPGTKNFTVRAQIRKVCL